MNITDYGSVNIDYNKLDRIAATGLTKASNKKKEYEVFSRYYKKVQPATLKKIMLAAFPYKPWGFKDMECLRLYKYKIKERE